MPASLSSYRNSNLKRSKLIILFLLSPLFFFGQTLTGLWTGALSNDSTTLRKDQLFEIALTEYKGKVYGYSRSEFIVNDTLYYIVKRVKGTIVGDVCEVTDDDIIAYNFRGKLDKGIKVTSTFRRNTTDSVWYLAGNWKTNATKRYYSVSGKVDLEQEKDLTASKIFPHLEELKLAGDIAFYKERNETAPVAKIAKPQKIKTEYTFNSDPLAAVNIAAPQVERAEADIIAPDVKKPEAELTRTKTKEVSAGPSATVVAPNVQRSEAELVVDVKKPDDNLVRTETKEVDAGSPNLKPVTSNQTIAVKKPVVVEPKQIVTPKPETEKTIAKVDKPVQPTSVASDKPRTTPVQKTSNPVAANTETKKPETTTVIQKPVTAVPASIVVTKPAVALRPIEEITAKVTTIAGRKSEFSQVVDFKSDSLQLSLYDNGEIDGDTVSIWMNDEVIMAKQGLKASAIRKTIYINRGQEDFTLVLFAENLGKYPPNTGLLVVHDGEDTYHLRFSSDYQKSSGIVFRRKK
jgi:hypothetical protein